MNKKTFILGFAAALFLAAPHKTVQGAGGATPPPELEWSFHGPFWGQEGF